MGYILYIIYSDFGIKGNDLNLWAAHKATCIVIVDYLPSSKSSLRP